MARLLSFNSITVADGDFAGGETEGFTEGLIASLALNGRVPLGDRLPYLDRKVFPHSSSRLRSNVPTKYSDS
jgi:hypothetical protein